MKSNLQNSNVKSKYVNFFFFERMHLTNIPLTKYHFNRLIHSMQQVSLAEIKESSGCGGFLCVCFCGWVGVFFKDFSLQGFAFVFCLPTHNLPPVSHAQS